VLFSSYVLAKKGLLYKKLAHKMLMKLTTGVNFINILCGSFCTKVFWPAFFSLRFGFVIIWRKDIGAKAVLLLLKC